MIIAIKTKFSCVFFVGYIKGETEYLEIIVYYKYSCLDNLYIYIAINIAYIWNSELLYDLSYNTYYMPYQIINYYF
jgi:hypothetical protein